MTSKRQRLYYGGPVVLLSAFLLVTGACGTYWPSGRDPSSNGSEESIRPIFRDVTAAVGVNFSYRNGEEAEHYAILEELGGGLAALDFDGDGRLDLFVTGGGDFGGRDQKQVQGYSCKLYRNVRDSASPEGFRFEDVTAQMGLDRIDFYTHGAAVADFDNDGWPDLLVTGWGRLALFHNEPVDGNDPAKGRKFVDVTKQAGLDVTAWAGDHSCIWTTSGAWGDLDGDGFPDLYVCQYVDWSLERHHPTNCAVEGSPQRDVCSPKYFTGLEHKLFHNRGNGTFADVSKAAGLRVARSDAEYQQLDWLNPAARERLRQAATTSEAKFGKGLSVLFIDINGDGKPDIYVANDMVGNFLYLNRSIKGQPRFEEVGLLAGVALDDHGMTTGSMGVDGADYNGSGRASLWVTNYVGELHALYRNECRPGHECFYSTSASCGLAAIGKQTAGWGTGFLDLNHHGWEDLFFTAGDPYRHNPKVPRAQKPVLFRNLGGGRFEHISALGGEYFQTGHKGRGVLLADFDNDGRVDLAISHLNDPVTILHNEADTAGNHWLGVELRGAGHRDVVGARITLEAGGRKQTRFAKGGGSYLSSSDRRHVFGLGPATQVERLRVEWPSGGVQEWQGLAIDRYWQLTEKLHERVN